MSEGKNVKLYALSTCMWCKKTKAILEELGVVYDLVYVNELDGDERQSVIEELEKVNESRSFPTLVIGDKVIIGFKPEEIRAVLSDGNV